MSQSLNAEFDIIVAGAGHAGIEASLAASRMGCSVLMVTMDEKAIGRMSCNPAIGGTAKGHLVREIDALGGEMAKIADTTGIQFKMLNMSKGPAVWSPRSQNDREWYSEEAGKRLRNQSGIRLMKGIVHDVELEESRRNGTDKVLKGILLDDGKKIKCRCLILCAGTFLRGLMHTGTDSVTGGRYGEQSAESLTQNLVKIGFLSGRLKTGTPPRIDKNSIDFSNVEDQPSDPDPHPSPSRTKKFKIS